MYNLQIIVTDKPAKHNVYSLTKIEKFKLKVFSVTSKRKECCYLVLHVCCIMLDVLVTHNFSELFSSTTKKFRSCDSTITSIPVAIRYCGNFVWSQRSIKHAIFVHYNLHFIHIIYWTEDSFNFYSNDEATYWNLSIIESKLG